MKTIILSGALFFLCIPKTQAYIGLKDTIIANANEYEVIEDNTFITENFSANNDALAINTYDFLNIEKYINNPLPLNKISKLDLDKFYFLSAQQKPNFFEYKKTNGLFIDINELQNIPKWDMETVKLFQKYVTVNASSQPVKTKQTIIIQNAYSASQAIAYQLNDSNKNKFLGTPNDFFIKYNLLFKNINAGMIARQNAGEAFNKNKGFDFYSLFAKVDLNVWGIQSIYLGDYTLQIGQGLIEWQRFSFNKSQEVLNVQKNFPVFQVHNSPSAINFKRGVAFNMKIKNVEINPFFSYRLLDANLDSNHKVSSIIKTDYHRSNNESDNKNILSEISYGVSTKYNFANLMCGANFVAYNFNYTLNSNTPTNPNCHYPYQNFWNASFYYEYLYRSISLFGEIAMDKNFKMAVLNGGQVSINKYIDLAFVHRYYDVFYQAIYANAFRESSTVNNEQGFYMGGSFNFNKNLQFQYYLDIVNIPWLKYNQFSGSKINEHFFKIIYLPNNNFLIDFFAIFKNKNYTDYVLENNILKTINNEEISRYRLKIKYLPQSFFEIQTQYDLSFYKNELSNPTNGFSWANDIAFKDFGVKNMRFNLRLQYFEIPDDNTVVYLFEKDVLRDFTINSFTGKGCRYYINLHYKLFKYMFFSFKWSQTIYDDKENQISSYTFIDGNFKGDLKAQVIVSL